MEEFEEAGKLVSHAASMVMKLLWLARMSRWDLLRQVNLLARLASKWSIAADKLLYRLICYLNCTLDCAASITVGDDASKWQLHLYQDADHAGDIFTKHSTSGIFAMI